jgi:hypothetical protein
VGFLWWKAKERPRVAKLANEDPDLVEAKIKAADIVVRANTASSILHERKRRNGFTELAAQIFRSGG